MKNIYSSSHSRIQPTKKDFFIITIILVNLQEIYSRIRPSKKQTNQQTKSITTHEKHIFKQVVYSRIQPTKKDFFFFYKTNNPCQLHTQKQKHDFMTMQYEQVKTI
jgi:hypothetical protein